MNPFVYIVKQNVEGESFKDVVCMDKEQAFRYAIMQAIENSDEDRFIIEKNIREDSQFIDNDLEYEVFISEGVLQNPQWTGDDLYEKK